MKMYSTHNQRKSVVAGKFFRTSKNKICKYMTSASKIVHIDKLDDLVNKCSNTYLSIIQIKPVDVKLSTWSNFNKEKI